MDRVMSVEEKIRRAEEIYERRRQSSSKPIATVSVNKNKKDIKLLKKMIIQIIICASIYMVVYVIQSNGYIFSKDFTQKLNQVLSYDTNFADIYHKGKDGIKSFFNNIALINSNEDIKNNGDTQNQDSQENQAQNEDNSNGIGGANEGDKGEEQQLSQGEQDIINTKNTTSFVKPIEGTITSKFGQRDTATGRVPKNHTGTDIAANVGTKIKSATDGEVVLSSEEGDYGKHLKVQIGEVSIIYAHCNSLYVKQGDQVKQGQEIAEVGSTGNSTGPHLHFEIRYSERIVDPQSILEL